MRSKLRVLYQRVTLTATAFVLAVSTLTAAVPFIFSANVGAVGTPSVVYSALPSVSPSTNYPSYGLQAHSIGEYGDKITLAGTNRVLESVTVTLSSWAKQSGNTTWIANNPTKVTSTGFYHPIIVNVYKTDGSLIASQEQNVLVPWRPESDASCAATSNGNGWKEGDVCYNFSGIASNATINFVPTNIVLPNQVLVGVQYQVQSDRTLPGLGVEGPYNSLNVAFPLNNTPTVGSDDAINSYARASWTSGYAGAFTEFEANAGYGTVGLQVNASALEAPSNLRFVKDLAATTTASGSTVKTPGYTLYWDNVSYEFERYQVRVTDPTGDVVDGRYTGWYTFDLNDSTRYGFFGAEQGTYSYEIRAKSSLNGQWSGWSTPVTLTYDVTKPGVELLLPTSSPINSTGTTLSVKATDNLGVNKVVANIYQGSSLLRSTQSTAPAGSTEYMHNVNLGTVMPGGVALPEGSYTVRYNATDLAGTLSDTKTFAFTVDNTVPAAPAVVNNDVYVPIGQENKVLEWTHDGNDVVKYEYREYLSYDDAVADNAYWTKDITAPQTSTTDTAWGGSVVLYWRVVAIDAAGNRSALSDIGKITTDRDAPVASLTPFASNPVNGTVTVEGSVSDNYGVTEYELSLYAGSVDLSDGGAHESDRIAVTGWPTSGATTVSGTSADISRELNTLELADGTYQVRLAVRDVAGNTGYTVISFTVDNTGPFIVIDSYNLVGNVVTPNVTSDDEAATYSWTQVSGSETGVTISDPTALEPDFTVTEDGTYEFALVATDALGNFSVTPFVFTFTTPVVDEEEEEGEPTVVTVNQTPIIISPAAIIDTGVLGEDIEAEAESDDADVAGDTTDIAAQSGVVDDNGNFMGLAWYWWVIIAAALGVGVWWLIGALRRRGAE